MAGFIIERQKSLDASLTNPGTSRMSIASTPEAIHQLRESTAWPLPAIFVCLGSLLGVAFALLNPPLQAPDEGPHLFRAYDVSQGHCIAALQTPIPTSLTRLELIYPPRVETMRRIAKSEFLRLRQEPLHPEATELKGNAGLNQYSCIPYLPAAVAIAAARRIHGAATTVIYAARIANLAIYLFFVYIALRLLPDFQVVVFLLALMPTTLYEASSISIDGMVISSAFVFFAAVLRLGFDQRIRIRFHPALCRVRAVCNCLGSR